LGALAPPVLLAWDARVNRIQALVIGFFLVVWVILLVILVVAPEIYDQALRLPGGRGVELAVLAALSAFIGLLAVGVVRCWRWTFWLILVAFLLQCASGAGGRPAHRGPGRRRRPGMCCVKGCSAWLSSASG
jgi:hypothetical protein